MKNVVTFPNNNPLGEAAAAYNKAAKELHGEFASLNRVA